MIKKLRYLTLTARRADKQGYFALIAFERVKDSLFYQARLGRDNMNIDFTYLTKPLPFGQNIHTADLIPETVIKLTVELLTEEGLYVNKQDNLTYNISWK